MTDSSGGTVRAYKKYLLLVFVLPIFVSCLKNNTSDSGGQESAKKPPVMDPGQGDQPQAPTSCERGPTVRNHNFADFAQDYYLLMDEDDFSSIRSSVVNPGDMVFIEVDYKCHFDFKDFQFRNQDTNAYAFGEVSIYAKKDIDEPQWQSLGTYDQSSMVAGANFKWTVSRPIADVKQIRYEFRNNTSQPMQFIISDLETDAVYLDDPDYGSK